jgi:hypothetical protein
MCTCANTHGCHCSEINVEKDFLSIFVYFFFGSVAGQTSIDVRQNMMSGSAMLSTCRVTRIVVEKNDQNTPKFTEANTNVPKCTKKHLVLSLNFYKA